MSLSILQKIQVFFLVGIIKVIYLADSSLAVLLERVSVVTGRIAIIFISVAFLFFIGFSIKTQYLSNVFQGFIASQTSSPKLNYNSLNVLGASAVKPDTPILVSENPFPEVTSRAILVIDKSNNKTLYEKNSKTRLASASTTKLMTALIALDIYSLDEVITIPQNCIEIESSKANLPQDKKFRVESLLNAMLVSSAGDAACALAQAKIGEDEFVYRMNQKAHQLKMTTSYFTNPIGLDGLNSSHFSSASDLAKLSSAAMEKRVIQQIVAKKEYTIKSTDESYIGKLETTNKLLFEIPYTIGVKTGTTLEAGQVLIYEYDDDTKDLLIIVMGSEDRFSDVRAILQWVLASYSW